MFEIPITLFSLQYLRLLVYLASVNYRASLVAKVIYISHAIQSPYSEPPPLLSIHQATIPPTLDQPRPRYQTDSDSPCASNPVRII